MFLAIYVIYHPFGASVVIAALNYRIFLIFTACRKEGEFYYQLKDHLSFFFLYCLQV